uniref:ENTH domain-containing protein n=1 Tax=Oryzias latipes TaxID=8090 RepID=A0A3P9HTN6_ORYLA
TRCGMKVREKVKATNAEIKVREATCNDPWGPPVSLMSEISDLTFNVVAFADIMRIIWKRLNDNGKNWRHVFKLFQQALKKRSGS